MPRRILLVVNPVAGRGRALRMAERFLRAFRAEGGTVEQTRTAANGDGTRHAAEARDGRFDAVVACGGDGTVNEILHGLEGTSVPVGILPTGTANVLARDLGIPFAPEEAARVAARGEPRVLDLGEAREGGGRTRPFLCCAGAGFDGAVVRAVAGARRERLGFRGWVRPLWREIRGHEFRPLRVTVDGVPAAAATLAVVCNTANYGGLFTLVPGADPGDGFLDACLVDARRRRSFFRYLWGAWRGTLPEQGDVATARGRTVRVEADRPVPVQVDGDPFGTTPLVATLRPGAARVLVPGR
jgi:YegS/Rv2252/BmrU family lipid kinase